jgi:hypothetical protein
MKIQKKSNIHHHYRRYRAQPGTADTFVWGSLAKSVRKVPQTSNLEQLSCDRDE